MSIEALLKEVKKFWSQVTDYDKLKREDDVILHLMKSKNFHEYNSGRPESKRYEYENHSYWSYLDFCVDSASVDGLWLEFGVADGNSAKHISNRMKENKIDKTFFGFDSFLGLPEDWVRFEGDDEGKKGTFSTNGAVPDTNNDNLVFVKGWFDQTLHKFLDTHEGVCSFVHIDCDIYSSTYTVLNELIKNNRLVNGTVILFDEFYGYEKYREHEYEAFLEVTENYGIKYEWLAHTTGEVPWNGQQAALKVL